MADELNSRTRRTKTQHIDEEKKAKPESAFKLRVLDEHEHVYNPDRVQDFIDTVFHSPLADGAHRLVYSSVTNTPHKPNKGGVDSLINKTLRRTTKAQALYFNTSSCVPDAAGVLRHKKELFSAYHVLVLDDIGTKIPLENLPKALRDNPTYIIESSEGNYQYGYVLDEPITNYEHAVGLMQAAALAGLTDKGGLTAAKVVRLPDGVNGKNDPSKRLYPVTLKNMDGPYWTPDVLLKHINLEIDDELVTWEKITTEGFQPVAKRYNSQYLPRAPISQASNGVIDPVLEWLYENDMVTGDTGGDWVEIICPWGHGHTTGDDTAGYMPLGRGEDPYMRGFNCFHEHCADNKTREFIGYVLTHSDFDCLPVKDPSIGVFERYCFEETGNRIWRLDSSVPTPVDVNGFKTKYNQRVTAFKQGSKGLTTRTMTVAQLWLESPYRQDVDGVAHIPDGPRFVRDPRNGTLTINTYRPPIWGDGIYDQADVDVFLDYVDYLLPAEDERDYFLDWLTCKAKNTTFRGTGIVMVTPAFGVGRSTLGNMISTLLGSHNSLNVPFDDLLGATQYNYWELAQFVVVSEAKESADFLSSKGPYKAYETLKQRLDTTNNMATVNIKYEPQRSVKVCTSYLILTQHLDAVAIPREDRRLTVMSNPLTPADPEYFTKLNKWLQRLDDEDQPVWARSVYRYLRQREVKDTERLMLPLNNNMKQVMVDESSQLPARVCTYLAMYLSETQKIYAATQHQLLHMLMQALMRLDYDRELREAHLKNCLNDITMGMRMNMRAEGVVSKVRIIKGLEKRMSIKPDALKALNADVPLALKTRVEADVKRLNMQEAVDFVVDNMPR
jgi:hypothetical protein